MKHPAKPKPATKTEREAQYEQDMQERSTIRGWQSLGNGKRRKALPKKKATE